MKPPIPSEDLKCEWCGEPILPDHVRLQTYDSKSNLHVDCFTPWKKHGSGRYEP